MPLFEVLLLDDHQLQKNRVDLWLFSLNSPPHDALLLLSHEELARAHRFHFEHHRRRFLAAHAQVRLILARYLQDNANQLSFTYNQYGKPQVINAQTLEFNLSHSGELGLLAVGQNHPVGVDLEYFSARPYAGIASNLFSLKEQQQWSSLPAYLKPLSFFHIWAQKESFIKACGMGLSYPTQQFDVPVLPPTHEPIFDSRHKKLWNITSFMPEATCCAALCHHPEIENIRYGHCK